MNTEISKVVAEMRERFRIGSALPSYGQMQYWLDRIERALQQPASADVEREAMELLAAEYQSAGMPEKAGDIRAGDITPGCKTIAIRAISAALRKPQQEAEPVSESTGWRPMATAPRDGTMVRLLVDFTEHQTEDSLEPSPTIGSNNFENDGEDRWLFAGWCWSHDHFTQGEGTPVGWLPMLDAVRVAPQPATCNGAIDLGQFMEAVEFWKRFSFSDAMGGDHTAEADRLLALIDAQEKK